METTCVFCGATRSSENSDTAITSGTTRALAKNRYGIWRCASCRSIHATDPVDYKEIYAAYPLHRQTLDWIARIGCRTRLRRLKSQGLKREHRIIDYGTGGGTFVQYLRLAGYAHCVGYDPYDERNNNEKPLQDRYEFVLCQDVIEHADDPLKLLASLVALVETDGTVCIGSPNAERIDLHSKSDQVGPLHQPFHRHIPSAAALERLLEGLGFRIFARHSRWYFDTRIPLINSAFIIEYWRSTGGVIDAGLEPIKLRSIVLNPRLWLYALFGYWLSRKQDLLFFARRANGHGNHAHTDGARQ